MAASTRRRADAWLDLVADVLASPGEGWPAETVVRLLLETFDAPGGVFTRTSRDGTPLESLQCPAALFARHRDEIERWSAQEAPRRHPLLRYYLRTGDHRPVQVLDVPEQIADRQVQGRWREWCRSFHEADVSSQLALPVGAGPAPAATFLVGRADRFTVGEMAFARRLHRLLSGLDRHLAVHAAWSGHAGPAAVDAADAQRLTARELVVLALLTDGRTAYSIARRLAIAERTVQKHLQRIYAKLGVTDRVGAVLAAQRLGLLPPSLPDVRGSRRT